MLPNPQAGTWQQFIITIQACVQGGQGARPPSLEIVKPKKKVIKANFKLFHPYFASFLIGNDIFSAIFKPFRFLPSPPLLRIPGNATAIIFFFNSKSD